MEEKNRASLPLKTYRPLYPCFCRLFASRRALSLGGRSAGNWSEVSSSICEGTTSSDAGDRKCSVDDSIYRAYRIAAEIASIIGAVDTNPLWSAIEVGLPGSNDWQRIEDRGPVPKQVCMGSHSVVTEFDHV
jgi:hypothetical protein